MKLQEFISKYKLGFILGFIYVLPIIIANRLYIDDLGRSADGYFRLSENGRPLADAVLHFLSFGGIALDTSPYTLLICVIVVVASSAYLCEELKIQSKLATTIIPIALLISPNFLENLSYKFDSVTMGLSVAAIVFSIACTANKTTTKKFFFASFLMVASLCLYQASINLIVSLTLAEFYILKARERNSREAVKTLLTRLSSTIFGYIIYSKLIAPIFVIGYYNENHSDIIGSIDDFLRTLENLIGISSYMFMGVGGWIIGLCFLTASVISLHSATVYFERSSDKITQKLFCASVLIISPFAVIFCIFGSLALLRDPVLHPRVLIGSGGMMLYSFILVAESYHRIIKVLPIVATVSCFSLSAAYGNTLTVQSEMERNIAGLISSDINVMMLEGNSGLFVNGRPDLIPSLKKTKASTPIIQLLIPNNFKEKWVFSNFYLASMGMNYAYVPYGEGFSRMRKACESGKMVERSKYSIGSYGKTILIDFRKCK